MSKNNDASRAQGTDIVAEAGGPVDEARLTLGTHGLDVQPEGLFGGAWSRGFELSPTSVRQLAVLGIPGGFDIYAADDDQEDK